MSDRHGTWPSPITAARLVEGAAKVDELRVDDADVWWSESRPSEGGRTQLVRRTPDGLRHDVLPEGANARTRAHEYGGGAWCVAGGSVWWCDWSDQRLRRLDAGPGAETVLVTPEPARRHGWRWADLTVTPDRRWLVAVRESHGGPDAPEAVNELVAVPADGSAADDPEAVVVLVSGPDFVSSPRVSADGRHLAWIQWDHPRMPWDGTELWSADLDPATARVTGASRVAGGPDESIVQPEWHGGDLIAGSDRTGWWNPYRYPNGGGDPVPLAAMEAEIGGPQWVFGMRWYTVLEGGTLLASATAEGTDSLIVARPGQEPERLDLPYTSFNQVAAAGPDRVALVAAGPTTEPAPVILHRATGEVEVLKPPRDRGFGPEWFSVPEHLSFPSPAGGAGPATRQAHGLLYRPTNPDCSTPDGERPPLLVFIHGGPTSRARPLLQLAVQFWTSRGFAVVDVNYGGSTGYGRPYRELLGEAWGVVDVEDCVAAARHLADRGEVDGDRLAIRGGSAGGFTTLLAMATTDAFAAGASHYGVADLGALARDTHKFESRYLDRLVGPWPEGKATYDERSPINHTGGFDRPLIVFQGDEDEVVPPDQARMIVDALAARGVPHAYVVFEGEQHGFRQAANIIRALEAELWFYGRVFGFDPADTIEPVPGAVGL